MKKNAQHKILFSALLIGLAVVFIQNISFGQVAIPIKEVAKSIFGFGEIDLAGRNSHPWTIPCRWLIKPAWKTSQKQRNHCFLKLPTNIIFRMLFLVNAATHRQVQQFCICFGATSKLFVQILIKINKKIDPHLKNLSSKSN